MKKFDPIDIFFIAIISAYFITILCIGITLIIIKISKHKNKPKKLETTKYVIKNNKAKKVTKKPQVNKLKDLKVEELIN